MSARFDHLVETLDSAPGSPQSRRSDAVRAGRASVLRECVIPSTILVSKGSWTDAPLPPEVTTASLDAIALLLEHEVRFIRCGQLNHPVFDEQDVCPTDREIEVVEPQGWPRPVTMPRAWIYCLWKIHQADECPRCAHCCQAIDQN